MIRGHPRPDERVQLSLLCTMMGSRCPWEMILGWCFLMGGLLGPAWGMSGWGAGVGKVIRGHPRPDERVQLSLPYIMMGSRCPWEMILECLVRVGTLPGPPCECVTGRLVNREGDPGAS